jgi:hypothetical protein
MNCNFDKGKDNCNVPFLKLRYNETRVSLPILGKTLLRGKQPTTSIVLYQAYMTLKRGRIFLFNQMVVVHLGDGELYYIRYVFLDSLER